MSITPAVRPSIALAAALAAMLAVSGCTPAVPDAGPASPSPGASTTPPVESPGSGSAADGESEPAVEGDVLAERDAFIAEQQQPVGQANLTARTPAQQELVTQQRAYLEENGGQWSEQAETVTLALALDACETSILNGHEIDLASFRTHVATSPLIDSLAVDDASRAGAVSIMVFGTGFLCPADAPQWEQAMADASGQF